MQTWLRRILALIALVGSFFGLQAITTNIGELYSSGAGFFPMLLAGLGALIFIYGIFCGFWLLERRAFSTTSNVIFWLLQVPVLVTPVLTYKIFTGADFSLFGRQNFTSFGYDSSAPASNFSLALGDGGQELMMGINLFALLMIALLIAVGISTRREKSLLSDVKTVAGAAGSAAAMTGSAVVAGAKGVGKVAGGTIDAVEKVGDIASSATQTVKTTASAAGDLASDTVDVAKAAASTVGNVAAGATSTAAKVADKTADTATQVASGTADATKVAASTARSVATGAASTAAKVADKTADTTDRVMSSAAKTTKDVADSTIDLSKATASAATLAAGSATEIAKKTATKAGDAVDTGADAVETVSDATKDIIDPEANKKS